MSELNQLKDYCDYLVEVQDEFDVSRLTSEPTPPSTVLSPQRPIRRHGWLIGVVAAALVLVFIGGVAWLTDNRESDLIDDPTPTTVPQNEEPEPVESEEPEPVESEEVNSVPFGVMHRVISPGVWSVAAAIPTGASTDVNAVARDVVSWDGVFEVAIASDSNSWQELTGFGDCPVDGSAECGPGLVVLVAVPWMEQVALRLESDYGMAAVTAFEIPEDYWQAYVDAVTTMVPPDLTFDTSSLGEEMGLARSFNTEDEPGDNFRLSLQVEVEVDDEILGYSVITIDGIPGLGAETLQFNVAGQGGVEIRIRENTTDQVLPGTPRRVYSIAGLPLEAAVVATQLADGTPVWQRPVDGMVLIVDKVGSVPPGWTGTPQHLDAANPIMVLDADGNEIIRIEGIFDDPGIATDLRLNPITLGSGTPKVTTSSYEVVDTIQLSAGVWPGRGARNSIVSDGKAVWVGTQEGLVRIDISTSGVTNQVPVDGGVWDLLVDGDALWAGTNDNNNPVLRIDLDSGSITDTFDPPCDQPNICDTYFGGDLMIIGDDLWLTQPYGQGRIDLTTLDLVNVIGAKPAPWQPGLPRPRPGGDMWLGEANGLLWSLNKHQSRILGLNPTTGEQVEYDMEDLAGVDTCEGWAILVGDDIWLLPGCDRKAVRFDTLTRDISTVDTSGGFMGVVGADGALWTRGSGVDRVDINVGEMTDTIVMEGFRTLAILADQAGGIWVSGEHQVIRIDTTTRQITDVIEVAAGGQMLITDQVLWVAGIDGTITRIEAR